MITKERATDVNKQLDCLASMFEDMAKKIRESNGARVRVEMLIDRPIVCTPGGYRRNGEYGVLCELRISNAPGPYLKL